MDLTLCARIRLQLLVFALLFCASTQAFGQALDDFFHAVRADNLKAATAFLDRGIDPDTTNRAGNSVLIVAAEHGYADMVRLLLTKHASVNQRNAIGDTALMVASLKGHFAVVKVLVEAGADLNPSGWSPLAYASYGGHAPVVRYLLAQGAHKNAPAPDGYTPLMLAVLQKHSAAARELLYVDADLDYRAPDGETALRLAKREKDPALIALLRRAGARQSPRLLNPDMHTEPH